MGNDLESSQKAVNVFALVSPEVVQLDQGIQAFVVIQVTVLLVKHAHDQVEATIVADTVAGSEVVVGSIHLHLSWYDSHKLLGCTTQHHCQ